jgi:hypothetical protein
MYSGVTLYRAPNKDMPDEFLDICAGNKSDVIGGALAVNNELRLVRLDGSELQTVKDTCKLDQYKQYGLMLHFGNEDIDDDVPEDCQQPFTPLLGSDNSPMCVCFIEGEGWVGYDTTNTTNTIEFLVNQQYIVPKLTDLFTSVGDDTDKLIAKLRTPMVTREVIGGAGFGERGCISLLFANGEIVLFTKNPKHANFKWGWTSQRFGYDVDMLTGKPEVTATAPPVAKSMFGDTITPSPVAVTPTAPAAAASAAAAPAPQVTIPGAGPQPDVGSGEVSKSTTVLVYMPDNLRSNKAKKQWLSLYIGEYPAGWQQSNGPWPLKAFYARKDQLDELVKHGRAILAGKPTPAAVSVPEKPAIVEGEKPVIIGADDKKRIENIFNPIILGTLDTAGKYIADPGRLETELGKQMGWLEQMGWPTKEMMEKGVPKGLEFWIHYNTRSFWEQFMRTDIKSAVLAVQGIVNQAAKDQKALVEALKIAKAA